MVGTQETYVNKEDLDVSYNDTYINKIKMWKRWILMAYNPTTWANSPATTSPLGATNLNKNWNRNI